MHVDVMYRSILQVPRDWTPRNDIDLKLEEVLQERDQSERILQTLQVSMKLHFLEGQRLARQSVDEFIRFTRKHQRSDYVANMITKS